VVHFTEKIIIYVNCRPSGLFMVLRLSTRLKQFMGDSGKALDAIFPFRKWTLLHAIFPFRKL
jgi:hypothetical protein